MKQWLRVHGLAPPFSPGIELILVVDGLWFSFFRRRFVCYIILARSVQGRMARLRGLVLLPGDESEENWRFALATSLTAKEMRYIQAIVADGSHGLTAIARERGWKYQRCHFHLLKDLQLISGKRKGPTQWIRQRALLLARTILETPDERAAERMSISLRRLIAHRECPRTVRRKIGGFLRHYGKFRTCYRYPHLNIPHTSNSAETIGGLIRKQLGNMRGLRSPDALNDWLPVFLRRFKTVKCLPKTNRIIKS